MDKWEAVVGFEIHVELKTKSKMFCGCKNDPFYAKSPNIYTCPVCLGMPGGLPVPNKKAIEWIIRMGFALGCEVADFSKFDRKNYFYPDLPKGYQITQYDEPLAMKGSVTVDGQTVRIRRVHAEEDTGKLIHTTVDGKKVTLVDFNRSGVPLVEIVTEPDIADGVQAKLFLRKLQQIIRYLDISDADMEKGSMRLEPNISLRKPGTKNLPAYKVEVKNINSFRFASMAIDYEIERQANILSTGKTPVQETRGWDEARGATVPQRTKEEAADYRYFPEPDIPPMRFTTAEINAIQSQIGEMPDEKLSRFMKSFGLNEYDAVLLTETRQKADYFEEAVKVAGSLDKTITSKLIANWFINKKIDIETVMPARFVEQIVAATRKVSMPEGELEELVKSTVESNEKAVSDYKKGKEQALMFLVGHVMGAAKGKARAEEVKKMIRERLQ
ncbi:Asp-tRNA(Asn)/Glu-tRNA(Gln) amidotransferase subunit GatB [Candidatus Gottesmanbacteria bacterium]|nr:Asp-tRNA(Asn)/Glu-tRNA(Gln) amidotransferase subunit GatB [Candidatus Gottesmanbacteria bacterium]